ncbi:hypothetical protein ID854_08825 [Xenorhabdus sp. M]|uniref:Phage protein n=1 Tax=Xenorhabdus szentirmaii TaxID=290112 RepID=A0AAW3YU56_9GAMM|nr:hypothetical protein [Xenorhabdus sp. M]MBD2800556.1 hypothetical protein [Xenorhabdus sp. M]
MDIKIFLEDNEKMLQIHDWKEIVNRSNYVHNLDIKDKILKEIIGYYELFPMIQCGLKNCHKHHRIGYIVKTTDGTEANIGHQCGTKYFHVIFSEMAAFFKNKVNLEELKIAIRNYKSQIFPIWQKIHSLSSGEKNISWAISFFDKINNPEIIGRSAYMRLRKMYANNDGSIYKINALTKKEIEFYKETGRAIEESEKEVIGQIKHIDFLSPEDTLEKIFNEELRDAAQKLQDCDPDNLSVTKLKSIVKKANAIDSNILRAQEKISVARQFFTKKNLAELLKDLEKNPNVSNADIDRYKEFLSSLENNKAPTNRGS